jgi:ABC-type antimicrobial peptide transport system permease subunit
MRRSEIGTRMAIGAKGKDIVSLVFKDNAGALGLGLVISAVVLLVLYLGFSDTLSAYISLELLPLFIFTLASISLLSSLACYVPLRQYIKKPVIHSLKGSE